MTARWHLGPISGCHFWWVLVTSPEVLVFLFFMITDPKTAPKGAARRGSSTRSRVGLLAALLIAPMRTEYATKVALLAALTIVCVARPLRRDARLPRLRDLGTAPRAREPAAPSPRMRGPARSSSNAPAGVDRDARCRRVLPPITILPSRGVQTQLNLHTARAITHDLLADLNRERRPRDHVQLWLEPGVEQDPPFAVARRSRQGSSQQSRIACTRPRTGTGRSGRSPRRAARASKPPRRAPRCAGIRLTNVAAAVGLDFQQGSFRYGVSNDYGAMMGGGVCWLDYNDDGWQDLFAVNSYSERRRCRNGRRTAGCREPPLFENVHGHFHNVSGAVARRTSPVQGDGCAAADLNGDGRTRTSSSRRRPAIDLLWNNGNGTFTEGARTAGLTASGWYAGVAVADVNGDGRPDVFVAGYTDLNDPVPNSLAGFPTNLAGVRDLLFLNEGSGADGHVAVPRGRRPGRARGGSASRHGLGAVFLDYNGDGRPDLYVANDEDPNQLYENVPWPGGAKADPAGLGFRFEERRSAGRRGRRVRRHGRRGRRRRRQRPLDLFVTNSRREPSAAFAAGRLGSPAFANARSDFDPALGADFAGWGASWVDLANSGSPDLVVAAGGIPVTNLAAGRGPGTRARSPVRQGTAGEVRRRRGSPPCGRPARERARSRRGRRRQRRPRWTSRSTRSAASSCCSADRPDRPLARRGAVPVHAGRRRHGRPSRREPPRSRGAGRQQLPVLRGLRASTSGSARRRSEASVTVRYPWGRAACCRNVRADRIVDVAAPAPAAAAAAGSRCRTRSATCTPATFTGARSRRSGTTAAARSSGREAPPVAGARPLRPLRRDVGCLGRVRPDSGRLLRHCEGAGR